MLKKLFYSVLLLAVLLFLSSCLSTSSKNNSELPAVVTKNENNNEKTTDETSYESYKWTPPIFTENELQPEEKPYADLFKYDFPTSLNISNVPPSTSVPYAIVDDPNKGRLYITDFPIKNEENSFTIGE